MAEAITEDCANVQARDNVPMTGGAERLEADMRGLSVAGPRDPSAETMQQYLEQQAPSGEEFRQVVTPTGSSQSLLAAQSQRYHSQQQPQQYQQHHQQQQQPQQQQQQGQQYQEIFQNQYQQQYQPLQQPQQHQQQQQPQQQQQQPQQQQQQPQQQMQQQQQQQLPHDQQTFEGGGQNQQPQAQQMQQPPQQQQQQMPQQQYSSNPQQEQQFQQPQQQQQQQYQSQEQPQQQYQQEQPPQQDQLQQEQPQQIISPPTHSHLQDMHLQQVNDGLLQMLHQQRMHADGSRNWDSAPPSQLNRSASSFNGSYLEKSNSSDMPRGVLSNNNNNNSDNSITMMALQEVMGKIQSAGGVGSSEAQSGPPSGGSQGNVSNSSNLTKMKMVVAMGGGFMKNNDTKQYEHSDGQTKLVAMPTIVNTYEEFAGFVIPDGTHPEQCIISYVMPSDESLLVTVESDQDVEMMMDEWRDLNKAQHKMRIFVDVPNWPVSTSVSNHSPSDTSTIPSQGGDQVYGPRSGPLYHLSQLAKSNLGSEGRGPGSDTSSRYNSRPLPSLEEFKVLQSQPWEQARPDREGGYDTSAGTGKVFEASAIGDEKPGKVFEASAVGDEKVSLGAEDDEAEEEEGQERSTAGFSQVEPPADMTLIDPADVELCNPERPVSAGGYGVVHRAHWNGVEVAVKYMHTELVNAHIAEFYKEASILFELRHPNVVTVYGLMMPKVQSDNPQQQLSPAIVTEYAPLGSLRNKLSTKPKELSKLRRIQVAYSAARGMEFLHSRKIVHLDLKSDNMLMHMQASGTLECKVCDFGLSKQRCNTYVSQLNGAGTVQWMAPEVVRTPTEVTELADVYSFGIVLWELWTNDMPYQDMNQMSILGNIMSNTTLRPPIPGSDGTEFVEPPCPEWESLMKRCWASNPNQRPPFSEVSKELEEILKVQTALAKTEKKAKATSDGKRRPSVDN